MHGLSTVALDAGIIVKLFQYFSMSNLLEKFRIPCTDVIIIPDVTTEAREDTYSRFEEISTRASTPTHQLLEHKERSNRYLRLAEILQEQSADSQMVVM